MKELKIFKKFLNEGVEKKYATFLNSLRDSGQTNMFGAGPYLESYFNLSKKEAREILAKWMRSFDEDPNEIDRDRIFMKGKIDEKILKEFDDDYEETFDIGDRVELKPDYEETPGEIFTITQTSSGGRYFISDKDGRGWYAFAYQLAMADEEMNEDHTEKENNQLKKISKQLKKSVKSHDKQSKIIDKIIKEIRL